MPLDTHDIQALVTRADVATVPPTLVVERQGAIPAPIDICRAAEKLLSEGKSVWARIEYPSDGGRVIVEVGEYD